MKGINAYKIHWHPTCDVEVVDIGGFAYLYCRDCGVLANMQAVSVKHITYEETFEVTKHRARAQQMAALEAEPHV